jgi:hypothetical protein
MPAIRDEVNEEMRGVGQLCDFDGMHRVDGYAYMLIILYLITIIDR